MAFAQENWLDIWHIWEFEIIGGLWLAIFISVIIVLIICAKFNTDYKITTLILCFFGLVISGIKLGSTDLIYAYTVLIIAGLSYYLYSQTFKRG